MVAHLTPPVHFCAVRMTDAPRYNPASRYFDPAPLASAYHPPPAPGPGPIAMAEPVMPAVPLRADRECIDEFRTSQALLAWA